MPTVVATNTNMGVNTREMSVAHGRNMTSPTIGYQVQPAGRQFSPANVILDVDLHTKVYINLAEG